MKAEYAKLIDGCIELEAKIVYLYEHEPRLNAHSTEDLDDAYQARLEWQWEQDDLNEEYIDAQKKAAAVIPGYQRPIRTAKEYYKKYLSDKRNKYRRTNNEKKGHRK